MQLTKIIFIINNISIIYIYRERGGVSKRVSKHCYCLLRSDRSVRWADPFARLHSGTWSQNKQGSCNGKQVQHKQDRVILGQAWVFDRRTISNRARQRDNPGTQAIVQARRKQSPNGKAKGLIQETRARIKTLENRQGKARQGKTMTTKWAP